MSKRETARLADVLRSRLEEEIVSGQLAPGERLDEIGLAERFGVSRTPVRESLMRLASVGLIEMRPRQGAVVAAITVPQLLQMFEVMAELESFCARLAARRMTPDERTALVCAHKSCGKLAKKADVDAYYAANRDFHEVIYAGSHNDYLQSTTRTTRNRLEPYRRFQLHHAGRLATSWTEHDQVIEAILAGDADAAATAMSGHVAVQGDVFSDLISALPPAYLQAQTG